MKKLLAFFGINCYSIKKLKKQEETNEKDFLQIVLYVA
jgi:hypothetical protein